VSFADGPPPGEGSDTEAANAKGDISAPKKPAEIDPDDLLDEEFGPTKAKSKKGKKGKGKKVAKDEDDDDDRSDGHGTPEPSGSICVRFSDILIVHATRTNRSPFRRAHGRAPREGRTC
jgi:hypothetical protein